jgi:predicted helicase
LEEAIPAGQQQFAQFINQEANEAGAIKRDKEIMVVLGNPPYSGHSSNNGEWITKLHQDYYLVDGKRLKERNSKWLKNDYIKFIRFGQWRVNKTQSGILAFITDNSYLDSLTMRGMRQQLMGAFDDIYILNLHGNSNKKEKTPEGGKDDNVFDIQQGVAIGIFVRNAAPTSGLKDDGAKRTARVRYADLWGVRAVKYRILEENNLANTTWETLTPSTPYYLFTPQNLDLNGEYEPGWKATDIFPVNVLGFQTHRDNFAVDFDKSEIYRRIKAMRDMHLSDAEFQQQYNVTDNRDWKLLAARKNLREDIEWEKAIITCSYRPFDTRYCYFSEIAMDYPRRELLQHVYNHPNLCLNTVRQTKMPDWDHILVSDSPAPAVYIEIKDGSSVFPLYLYRDPGKLELPGEDEFPYDEARGRRPNLSVKFVREMESKLGMTFVTDGKGDLDKTFGPEDVFNYAYAVFHSPTYRERYAEFLKIDFPRLPLTGDKALFKALCQQGAALVDLHLLRGVKIAGTTFPESGNNVVESGYPRYEETPHPPAPSPTRGEGEKTSLPDPLATHGEGEKDEEGKTGRVYINKTQYFGGIAPEVWAFMVGGYQVLEKWLKDRRGRELSYEDIQHYQKVAAALAKTIGIMEALDDLIPAWPLP